MGTSRRTGTRIMRSTADPLLWGLAALLSLGSLWLPKFLGIDTDPLRRLVIGLALFSIGALFGCLRPGRAWLWALAALAGFVLSDLFTKFSAVGFGTEGMAAIAALLQANAGVYCLNTLTVLFGALVGAVILRAGLD
jgi:hypothetical protein